MKKQNTAQDDLRSNA